MFIQLLANENTKNFRRAMLWIELTLIAALIAGLFAILYVTLNNEANIDAAMPPESIQEMRDSLTWPSALVFVLGFGASNAFGGLLIIIFVGAVTAQEYTWRTLHLWISQGVGRPMFLGAKFVSLLIPVGLIVLTPLLVGGAITAMFSLNMNGSLRLEQIDGGQLLWSILRTAYTLLPYAALAFWLGIASRSSIVAIGGGLAYSMLLEGILMQVLGLAGGKLAQIGAYMPGGLGSGLLALSQNTINVGMQAAPNVTYLTPAWAAVGIGLWTLLFLGLAMWTFQRQDLSQ